MKGFPKVYDFHFRLQIDPETVLRVTGGLSVLDPVGFVGTHCGGEEGAGFELLQSHGAGVGTEEKDEGHEGDVRDELAGFSHQLALVLQAVRL